MYMKVIAAVLGFIVVSIVTLAAILYGFTNIRINVFNYFGIYMSKAKYRASEQMQKFDGASVYKVELKTNKGSVTSFGGTVNVSTKDGLMLRDGARNWICKDNKIRIQGTDSWRSADTGFIDDTHAIFYVNTDATDKTLKSVDILSFDGNAITGNVFYFTKPISNSDATEGKITIYNVNTDPNRLLDVREGDPCK